MSSTGGGNRMATGGPAGDASASVLVAVAAFGLAGSRVPWPVDVLDGPVTDAVVAGSAAEGVLGLLAPAVVSGRLRIDPDRRAVLEATLAAPQSRTSRLEGDTIELSDRLYAAGVDHRVIDGPVTAHRGYGRPDRRIYATVAVLVGDERAAREELEDLESAPRLRLRSTLLPDGCGARVALADLPAPDTVTVAGHHLPALPVALQLVAACTRLVSGERGRLIHRRDIVQLTLNGAADTEGTVRWADEWRATAAVAQAVRSAWATFDLADKVALWAWAFRYEPSIAKRRRAMRGTGHDSDHPTGRLDHLTTAAQRLVGRLNSSDRAAR